MKYTSEQAKRYSRHFVLREIGIFGQEKLLSGKVLVIGAGGLGSSAIMYLAAAGVGTLGIADYDVVDYSNLQRQVIHGERSVGARKVESAREFVHGLNSDVKVETISERLTSQNILQVVENYDFVLDCTDRFETKFLINDACVLAKKPYCHAGAIGFEGQIMTYLPGSACLRCLLGEIPKDAPTCEDFGVVGAAVGVLGSMQALEAVKFLVGQGELLVNRLLKYDGLASKVQIIKCKPDSDCRACGKNAISALDDAEYSIQGECNGR